MKHVLALLTRARLRLTREGGPFRYPSRSDGPRLSLMTLVASALGCLASTLTACAPGSSVSVPHPTTSTPIPIRTPTVVFRADWSKGLAGWHATAGWLVQSGAVQSDTGEGRTITVPYQPTSSDYDVEYTLQVVEPHDHGECHFKAAPTPNSDGYDVILRDLYAPGHEVFAKHPQFGIIIDPEDDMNAGGGGDFEPGPNPRSYLIQVRGPGAAVRIDHGAPNWHTASDVMPTLSEGPLTFTCSLAGVRLTSLTISTLSSQKSASAAPSAHE